MFEDVPATEADRIVAFGISFRSKNHYDWFRVTLATLGVLIILRLLHPHGLIGPGLLGYKLCRFENIVIWVFIQASIQAAIQTKGGRLNGKSFSRDCIWYNALVAVVAACIVHAFR